MLQTTDHLLALDTLAASEAFKEAVYVARLGHYIGVANINDAGLDLLEALAKLRGKREGKEQSYDKGAVRESIARHDTQRRRLSSLVEHALARVPEALEMGDRDKAPQ